MFFFAYNIDTYFRSLTILLFERLPPISSSSVSVTHLFLSPSVAYVRPDNSFASDGLRITDGACNRFRTQSSHSPHDPPCSRPLRHHTCPIRCLDPSDHARLPGCKGTVVSNASLNLHALLLRTPQHELCKNRFHPHILSCHVVDQRCVDIPGLCKRNITLVAIDAIASSHSLVLRWVIENPSRDVSAASLLRILRCQFLR